MPIDGVSAPAVMQLPLLSEQHAQDEHALLAEMSEWNESINGVLDADGVQEVNVSELASSVAGWCKDAGTEAATSLAKKATSILPRNQRSQQVNAQMRHTTMREGILGGGDMAENLPQTRRRTSTSTAVRAKSGETAPKAAARGSWLSTKISSILSIVAASPLKSSKGETR